MAIALALSPSPSCNVFGWLFGLFILLPFPSYAFVPVLPSSLSPCPTTLGTRLSDLPMTPHPHAKIVGIERHRKILPTWDELEKVCFLKDTMKTVKKPQTGMLFHNTYNWQRTHSPNEGLQCREKTHDVINNGENIWTRTSHKRTSM